MDQKKMSAPEFARIVNLLARLMDGMGPPEGLHKHKCPECRVVWEHERPPPEASSEEYRAAHLCPRGCGVDVRWVYESERKAA